MKKKAVEKDTSDRYLLTYADLMNLLLILFIILYSMSKTDVAKATAVAESVRKGFNAISTTSQTNQSPSSSNTSSEAISGAGDYSGFYDKLIALINQAGMQNQVDVVADSTDVVITLKDTALYQSGSAVMNAQATNLMTSIGQLLTQVTYSIVMVEGYTDTDPIKTDQFADNLDLSTARANGVNRVLQAAGVPVEKLDSMGHGANDPIAKNDTAEHKAMNRRVVLTICKTNVLTAQQIIAYQDLLGNLKSNSSSSAASGSASKASSSSKATSSKTSSSKTSSK
jgi:chemotaxis protein MotB